MNSKMIAIIAVIAMCGAALVGVGYAYTASYETGNDGIATGVEYVTIGPETTTSGFTISDSLKYDSTNTNGTIVYNLTNGGEVTATQNYVVSINFTHYDLPDPVSDLTLDIVVGISEKFDENDAALDEGITFTPSITVTNSSSQDVDVSGDAASGYSISVTPTDGVVTFTVSLAIEIDDTRSDISSDDMVNTVNAKGQVTFSMIGLN